MRKQSLQLQKAWLKMSGSVRGLHGRDCLNQEKERQVDFDDASDSGAGEDAKFTTNHTFKL